MKTETPNETVNETTELAATEPTEVEATAETPEIRWSRPPADVLESADAWTVILDVPGASAQTVSVELDGRTLTVEATRGDHRGYRRAFELPVATDVDGIEAHAEAGVLTLTLPRKPEVQPRTIPVQG